MIHPSGVTTTDYEPCEVYEPNRLQIANAARRAQSDYLYRPRYRVNPEFFIKAVLIIALLSGLILLVNSMR